MSAATLLAEIEQAGAEIWADGDRLKFQGVPARLIPLIRENKPALLALLSPQPFTPLPSEECADAYAMAERRAIQAEDNMPPDRGWADVSGFRGMPDLTAAEHGAILHRLTNAPLQAPARREGMDATTTPAPMQPAPAMAPQRVSCGQCCRFQPGPQPLSIGRCLATVDGSPPKDQRGYLAAFPMAQRQCPEFSGVAS